MANIKGAKKRMRQNVKKRAHNQFYAKRTRSFIRRLRNMTSQEDAKKFLPTVISEIDKLAKRHIWHANKAANLKSKLTRFVNGLS